MRSEVAAAMSLDTIRYSQVWEDHRLLEEGLLIGPDDDVLSITSAGCNVLALLLQGPRSITAIDMSAAQNALLELKLAAIRRLEHAEFAVLMGVREPGDGSDAGAARAALYARLRDDLPAYARAQWDARPADLASGVIHCGRLERYLGAFAPKLAQPPGALQALLAAPDLPAQRAAWQALATPQLEAAFRAHFNRDVMARQGRDPAQFRWVEALDVESLLWQRFQRVCTELPVGDNFYLEFVTTGRYSDLAKAPPYLTPAGFARLKGLVDRVTIVTDELERFLTAAPAGAFNRANLSDIFEYASAELTEQILSTFAARFRRGGRLGYWNLFVPRHRPESLAARLRRHEAAADALWRRDRAFFYGAFQLEEIL